jgi:hypothetical protein
MVQVGLKEWALGPNMTYPTNNVHQGLFHAAAVLTWAHTCGPTEAKISCDQIAAADFYRNASLFSNHPNVRKVLNLCHAASLWWIRICRMSNQKSPKSRGSGPLVPVQVLGRDDYYPVSNWDNPIIDGALMLSIATGELTGKWSMMVHRFVAQYVAAEGLIGYDLCA